VAQSGFAEGERFAVVHQPRVGAHAPQRRRAELVRRRLAAILHDAVAGAYIVQQEVAERVDDLVGQSRGHRPPALPVLEPALLLMFLPRCAPRIPIRNRDALDALRLQRVGRHQLRRAPTDFFVLGYRLQQQIRIRGRSSNTSTCVTI